jgi:hypothetical protein
MSSLFFWNAWAKEYRVTWYVLSVIFILSMLFMWHGYFFGTETVFGWQKLQEQKILETSIHTFRLGPFVINVPGESYVILEYLEGSQVKPNIFSSYIFLAITFISLTVVLSVVTVLDKLWFYFGLALYSLLIFSLRLEVLGIFGVYSKITGVVAISFYLLPSFYFSQLRPSTPFVVRLGVFSIITIALGFVIGLASTERLPFYHLVLTSFTPTIIISVIFLILVAHEIFASFVYIASQGSTRSIQHLTILCTIYFANLLLTLAFELGLVSFDFIYLNVFLLLTISAILGVWGFRSREVVYQNLFPFYPFGSLLFLALGAICFSTIGHQLQNANDPGVFALRHAILFSQAGYGVIFLLYVLSNFGQMLSDNGPVHKVLYQPHRMPYFTYRLAGFIAMLSIFIYGNWRTYVFNTISAFYITAGDFYTLLDDVSYANAFYQRGSSQGTFNNRSNYALAMNNASRYHFEEAHELMEDANTKRPTPYSLTNAGTLFIKENRLRESVAAYRRSLEVSPDISAIFNNAAVSYIKLHHIDSALYFLGKARESKLTRTQAETNFFAMAALETIPINADSVYKSFDNESIGVLGNLYALSTILGVPVDQTKDPLGSERLDLYTATYLNNYILKNAKQLDTVFTNKAFKIASDSLNSDFSEVLKSSLAYAFYHQGNIARALQILAEQVYLSQSYQGKFNYVMGLWALEQNNPMLAADYFNYAETYEFKDAPFYHAIALTEAGQIREALVAWDSVQIRGDASQKEIASNVKRILTLPISEASGLSDGDKYQLCRYRISRKDSVIFNRILSSFDDPNYRAQALLDYSKRFLEAAEIEPAIRFYQRIGGLQLTNQKLYDDVRRFELRLLSYRGDLNGLATQINKGIKFREGIDLEKIYYTALLSNASADSINAKKNFAVLARYNPYFEEGIIAAYNYFNKLEPSGFEAYNILAEAIQINGNSILLLKAYHDAALNVGLEQYAASAAEKIRELEQRNW